MGKKAQEYGDFKMYYDSTHKRNIWVMGYFGGGAVNVTTAMVIAKEYAEEANVPLEGVMVDEILSSRRFKGFKFFYSTEDNQKPIEGSDEMENVYQWLRD